MRLLLNPSALPLLSVLLLGLAAEQAFAQQSPEGGGDPAKSFPGSPPERTPPDADPAPAKGKAGHGAVEFRLGYYDNSDDDSSGNPFLDESLTDIEPVVILEYQATDKLRLSLTGSYDYVSSASIERLSNYSQQSGASGDYYFSADLAASYEASEDFRWGGHIGASFEYDYRSFGAGISGEVDLLDDNVTLSAGLNAFFDQIDVIRFNGEDDGGDSRLSVTLNLGYYQILSPTLHLSLGTSLTYQGGFLQTAYNGVVLEDPSRPVPDSLDPSAFIDLRNLPPGVSLEAEELPDTRLRAAVYGELRKGFPDTGTALGFAGRVYADSWGIVSFAPELRLYQWIVSDLLRTRIRYRFYAQTAADAYEDHFRVPQSARSRDPLRPSRERTQDADLGDFTSHTLGLKFVLTPTDRITIDAGADYVLRSDGIDQFLFSFGFRWEF